VNRLVSRLLNLTGCFLTVIFFRGCAVRPNIRHFYKGNIEMTGIVNSANPSSGKLEYIDVNIDMTTPSKPPTQRLGIELLPGTITPLSKIDVSLLSTLSRPEPTPDTTGKFLPDEAVYIFRGYACRVRKGKLISVGIGNTREGILWDTERHRRYVMPLSENDVAELFGAPDRQQDTFQF